MHCTYAITNEEGKLLDGRIVNLRPILSEIEVAHELSLEISRTISYVIPR